MEHSPSVVKLDIAIQSKVAEEDFNKCYETLRLVTYGFIRCSSALHQSVV